MDERVGTGRPGAGCRDRRLGPPGRRMMRGWGCRATADHTGPRRPPPSGGSTPSIIARTTGREGDLGAGGHGREEPPGTVDSTSAPRPSRLLDLEDSRVLRWIGGQSYRSPRSAPIPEPGLVPGFWPRSNVGAVVTPHSMAVADTTVPRGHIRTRAARIRRRPRADGVAPWIPAGIRRCERRHLPYARHPVSDGRPSPTPDPGRWRSSCSSRPSASPGVPPTQGPRMTGRFHRQSGMPGPWISRRSDSKSRGRGRHPPSPGCERSPGSGR
jgi:hypothetical protein